MLFVFLCPEGEDLSQHLDPDPDWLEARLSDNSFFFFSN